MKRIGLKALVAVGMMAVGSVAASFVPMSWHFTVGGICGAVTLAVLNYVDRLMDRLSATA